MSTTLSNGLLYKINSDDEWTLSGFDGDRQRTVLSIPCQLWRKQITKIKRQAFENNANLETIIIPDSIRKIGSSAFAENKKLERIHFNQTILRPDLEICNHAFCYCSSLKEFVCSRPVNIAFAAFVDCYSLKKIDGMFLNIQELAFKGCCSLETAIFRAKGCQIADNAFDFCPSLKEFIFYEDIDCSKEFIKNAMFGKNIICKPDSWMSDLIYDGYSVKFL